MAFNDLKRFLTSPPVLTPPLEGERLLLYIGATTNVVSTVIAVECEEVGHVYKIQQPVYYVSEVLTEYKARYPQIQKLLYVVLITSRKLRHYFQNHEVTVVIEFPIGNILRNKDAAGRISKWAVELGALDITFAPRIAIKSHALANFMAEWMEVQDHRPAEKIEH